jgi:hypothetical protein
MSSWQRVNERLEIADYCREIEAYLCRKNDGHLIRVVGPSFEIVSRWASDGIPLKIAFQGIDRYFERYYRKGPRRRPVKIDFCDADVLDVFDEWRRAIGLTSSEPPSSTGAAAHDDDGPETGGRGGASLPRHLERVLERLTSARVSGRLTADADSLLDRVSAELDEARSRSRGLRGDAREALVARLAAIDGEVLEMARTSLDADAQSTVAREADEELGAYRAQMAPEAYARARSRAIDHIVRERFGLPIISFG